MIAPCIAPEPFDSNVSPVETPSVAQALLFILRTEGPVRRYLRQAHNNSSR